MAHLYVTTEEVKTHLSISGSSQDALIDALIDGAETAGLAVPDFRQAYINGQLSTVLTGKLPRFLGASIHTDRLFKEANATGTTPSGSITIKSSRSGSCTQISIL